MTRLWWEGLLEALGLAVIAWLYVAFLAGSGLLALAKFAR